MVFEGVVGSGGIAQAAETGAGVAGGDLPRPRRCASTVDVLSRSNWIESGMRTSQVR
jgi:hypothetical protein